MIKIGFLLSPGFQMMSLAALSAFEMANAGAGEALYEIDVISETGGPVVNSLGMTMDSKPADLFDYDTVVVTGALEPQAATPGILAFLRKAYERCRRVSSICTGAFTLAEAG